MTEFAGDLLCFVCGKLLESVGDVFEYPEQKYDAISLSSNGNYGSTLFDPMSNEVSLHIVICDEHFRAHPDRVVLHRRIYTAPQFDRKVFDPDATL